MKFFHDGHESNFVFVCHAEMAHGEMEKFLPKKRDRIELSGGGGGNLFSFPSGTGSVIMGKLLVNLVK